MPLALQAIPPTFAQGYCPASIQAFANDLLSGTTFEGSAVTNNIEVGDVAPTDTTKIWFKTVGGFPTDPNQFYKWHPTFSAWVKANPEAPSGFTRRLFTGTIGGGGDLETYDGGSAGAVTAISGPMWEVDTAYQDRIPIGVGPTLAPVVNTDYGDADASIALTEAQLPSHRHFAAADINLTSQPAPTATTQMGDNGGGTGQENYVLQGTATDATIARTSAVGAGAAVNILNPVRGTYLIRRSARIFYVG